MNDFWEWVDQRAEEVGIFSISELEKRVGVSNGTIRSRISKQKPPTVEMAEGLCRALRVDWVELWAKAGYVSRINQAAVNPNISDLIGLDAEIHQALRSTGDDFKLAVLKTIKTWLVLYEELRK